MDHIERLIDVSRRQQELLRDAAAERLHMAAVASSRTQVRWIGRLVGLRVLPAA